MWKVTFKGLFAKKFRLVLTSIAVVLGVAFMAGTFVLTDTLGSVFDDLFANTTKGVDAVVRAQEPFNAAGNEQRQRADPAAGARSRWSPTVRRCRGSTARRGACSATRSSPGRTARRSSNQAPTFGAAWYPPSALGEPIARAASGVASRARPTRSRSTSKTFADGDFKRRRPRQDLVPHRRAARRSRITGMFEFGGKSERPGRRDARRVHADDRAGGDEPRRAVGPDRRARRRRASRETAGARPHPARRCANEGLPRLRGDHRRAARQGAGRRRSRSNLSFFNTFLLIFALIALFVGAFIIYNTFSITVAQRIARARAPPLRSARAAARSSGRSRSRRSSSGSSRRSSAWCSASRS